MTPVDRAARVARRGIEAALALNGIEPALLPGVTAYLLATALNLPGAAVARAAGCTRQNVSKMMRRVEMRRDDPEFDRLLEQLERTIGGQA